MKTMKHTYTVEELAEGFRYSTAEERGVSGLNGKLVIQPEFQRNYLYGDGKKDVAVIESVLAGFPLGLIYFVHNDDGILEILDGQQRVTSLGRFVTGQFTVPVDGEPKFFRNLDPEAQAALLAYTLDVYHVEGTKAEVMGWFETINIAGIQLNEQELLNAIYSGPFVNAARSVFSRSNNGSLLMWNALIRAKVERQDFLATALDWISEGDAAGYMATHQHDATADELVRHFDDVLDWVTTTFPGEPYKEQRGIDWNRLYQEYSDELYDITALNERVSELYADPCVTARKGIWEFVLGNEMETKLLNVRIFDTATRAEAYRRQTEAAKTAGESNCPLCALGTNTNATKIWPLDKMQADHVTAWSMGGATDRDNCEMLCKTHNGAKGNK